MSLTAASPSFAGTPAHGVAPLPATNAASLTPAAQSLPPSAAAPVSASRASVGAAGAGAALVAMFAQCFAFSYCQGSWGATCACAVRQMANCISWYTATRIGNTVSSRRVPVGMEAQLCCSLLCLGKLRMLCLAVCSDTRTLRADAGAPVDMEAHHRRMMACPVELTPDQQAAAASWNLSPVRACTRTGTCACDLCHSLTDDFMRKAG